MLNRTAQKDQRQVLPEIGTEEKFDALGVQMAELALMMKEQGITSNRSHLL